MSITLAYAQEEDSIRVQPSPAEPQGQYGTQRMPDQTGEIKEDRVEIDKEQLPPAMQNELAQNPLYEGWQNGNVFHERNTDQFILHVVRENTTHTFRFDKEGTPIKTDAPINTPETRQ
jgi:hypothetical protein